MRAIRVRGDDVSKGKELRMSLPFQPMLVKPGDALGDFTTDRFVVEAIEQCLSLIVAAHDGQVKHISRLAEVQGRAGVQFVMKRMS
ncbi:hypothetical protein D3C86_1458340 [compost metagenome]